MGQFTLAGNPPIPVLLRRSAQAKRISLRLSRLDGRVTLTLPKRVSEAEAIRFAQDKEGWLRRHLAQTTGPGQVGLGQTLPIRGQARLIAPGAGRSVRLEADRVLVPGSDAAVPRKLAGFLKETARQDLVRAVDLYCDRLGKQASQITLRDTRSRWGSCTVQGRLMFSWRLILAPPEVLAYVAAHEVAHLRHMDHSPAFWDQVTALFGDWAPQRKWLRDHGAALHQYRFGD